MLKSIALKNFRAYPDTGTIPLNKLNIFLGANNAGKSTFASAIEVFFRSGAASGGGTPLRLEEMPSFASFDSVLRKHWSPKEARPKEFSLTYEVGAGVSSAHMSFTYKSGDVESSPVIDRIVYDLPKSKIIMALESGRSSHTYSVKIDSRTLNSQQLIFSGFIPFPVYRGGNDKAWQDLPRRFFEVPALRTHGRLEIVNPSRPVPRSAYVLEDPNLGSDDRDFLSYLISTFGSTEQDDVKVKNLIVQNLRILGLATGFDVATISKKTSTKIVALMVSPSNKRQKVTIADVGFGMSQALPLVVQDARLSGGVLIAYQPEVHLHPLAQSRLADIFVKSVGRGNQVFVETHSPDLILRLQFLISEGKINPSDVSVFCFENSGGSSRIDIVNFGKSGSPSIKWPAGFLDTSLSIARELAGSRMKSAPKPSHGE
jgi:hypothetical protein